MSTSGFDSASYEAALGRASQLLAEGRHPESWQSLQALSSLGTKDPRYHEISALCLIKLDQLHPARNALTRVLALDPQHPRAQELYKHVFQLIRREPRTCVIVGEDGFDGCVLTNLLLFYLELGFKVFFSRTPAPADLVVVMRFLENSALDFSSLLPGTPVHIYPYVGLSPEALCPRLKEFPVTVIAPSPELMVTGPNILPLLAPPPVSATFWCTPNAGERPLRIAHIGNYKSDTPHAWPERDALVSTLEECQGHVWGRGWEFLKRARLHGALPIHEVPAVYSQVQYALGLMYPFQLATRTFSSRLWQAPLAGAALIGEKTMQARFPGVYNLGLDNLPEKLSNIDDSPSGIQSQALGFWTANWCSLREQILQSLYVAPPHTQGYLPTDFEVRGNSVQFLKSGALRDGIVMV